MLSENSKTGQSSAIKQANQWPLTKLYKLPDFSSPPLAISIIITYTSQVHILLYNAALLDKC